MLKHPDDNDIEIRYIEDGDRVYSTGCFLVWDKALRKFIFDGWEDDMYGPNGGYLEYDKATKQYYEEI